MIKQSKAIKEEILEDLDKNELDNKNIVFSIDNERSKTIDDGFSVEVEND